MNEVQQHAGNREAGAQGIAELRLCTNGTMLCTLSVEGAASDIIAAHLHRCEGGDTPQTQVGLLCSGPPVVVFCGDTRGTAIAPAHPSRWSVT